MTTTETEKEKNIKFFETNLTNWLNDVAYKHKFVVIADQQVKNVFDNFADALNYATANFSPQDFVVQQVIGEDEQINFLKLAQ